MGVLLMVFSMLLPKKYPTLSDDFLESVNHWLGMFFMLIAPIAIILFILFAR